MSRRLAAVLLLACGATLVGCSTLSRPAVEKWQYVLEARRETSEPSRADGGVLDVRTFRVSPRIDGTRFVYRTGAERYESDFYHVFWASPQALVADETRRWLASAGVFEDIPESGSAVPPTHLLEGALAELHGDYRPGETPRAVIGLRFSVVDVRGKQPRVLLARDYGAEVPLEAADPDLLVAGWNTGLRRILAELEADLRELPGR